LIVGAKHLECALSDFVDDYNIQRAHGSLALALTNGRPAIDRWSA